MNINDFRNFVLFLIRKAQSGGNPSPDQFNISLERAYIGTIMQRYGNPHEYTPNAPVPAMAWQRTQKISDDLRFLMTSKTFNLSNGQLFIPDGISVKDINSTVAPKYLHFSSLRYNHITQSGGVITQKEVDIRPLKDTEIGSATGSHIAPPTTRFPVCAFYDTYIQIYPKSLQRANLTYLKVPTTPKWAYTNDNNGRPVYDSANSVDIDAPDDMINDIATRLLSYLGISIRDINFVQYQETLKQKGD